jgi:hypothetical protein
VRERGGVSCVGRIFAQLRGQMSPTPTSAGFACAALLPWTQLVVATLAVVAFAAALAARLHVEAMVPALPALPSCSAETIAGAIFIRH